MSKAFYVTEDGDISDGHHPFKELYRYRALYNAALFNEWSRQGLYEVHKSLYHHDGLHCFGDPKWFIVVAELPTGQISNHYRVNTQWDLFNIPERALPNVYDGHTPDDVALRLEEFLRQSALERDDEPDTRDQDSSSLSRSEAQVGLRSQQQGSALLELG